MSELRRDPFSGRWTVIVSGRSARPNEHVGAPPNAAADSNCPFCEGGEGRTPPEVAAVRPPGSAANGPGWKARVIPNKFPTLGGDQPAGALAAPPHPPSEYLPGSGVHEVVIESPRHSPGMPWLEPEHLRSLFRLFRDRLRALEASPAIVSATLYENWGPESGGTLWHPHAQIVATQVVPPRLVEEADRFAGAGGRNCLLERVTRDDLADRRRVVHHDDLFTVVAPYGSEYPFELRMVPQRHAASLSSASDAEVDALAIRLPQLLRALGNVLESPSYNWVVHGLGSAAPGRDAFHWHVELLPRLVRRDGFDLGSGFAVNPVAPEEAAQRVGASLGPGGA
jgi:UDPglucose--hexose-1-phosphate uridylyltransferase